MRFRHPFIDGFMPYKPPPWIPPPWSILHYRTVLILLIAFFRFTTAIPIVNDPRRIFHSNIINRHANITTTTTSFPTTFTPSTTLSLTTIRGDTTSSFHYDGFHSILNTRHTNYFITNRHLIFTTTTLPISNTPHIISTTSPIGDTIIFSYPSFGTTILPLNIQQQDKTNGNIIISTTIIDTHPIYNTNTPFISSSSLTLTDHFLITTKFSNTNSHINYYLHAINPTFIMVFVSPTNFCRPYLLLLPTFRHAFSHKKFYCPSTDYPTKFLPPNFIHQRSYDFSVVITASSKKHFLSSTFFLPTNRQRV
jgi:hypothetical protein